MWFLFVVKFLLQSSDNQGDEANVWARKPYKDLDLSNGPVLSDMVFDADKKHVYAMTSHEVGWKESFLLKI